MEILIVEDEENIAKSLKKNFHGEGHNALICKNAEHALKLTNELQFDLIILDWRLPGISGLEFCKKIREKKNKVPIILLTALSDISNKVEALGSGADDYITKPFSFKEVYARALAVTRRYSASVNQVFFDKFTVDLLNREVISGKNKVKLSDKEFELFKFFIDNKSSILSKELIAKEIWNFDGTVRTNVVETTIKNLRKKILELCGENIIKNLYGEGYVLMAE